MRTKWSVVVLVLLVIIIIVLFPKSYQSTFNYKDANPAQYSLKYESILTSRSPLIPNSAQLSLEGVVEVKMFYDAQKSYLGVKLTNLDIQMQDRAFANRLMALYSTFFLIEIAEDGEFLAYHFDGNEADFLGLKALFSLMQVRLYDEKKYEQIELDNSGTYAALYENKEQKLIKKRLAYTQMKQENVEIKFLHSLASITLGKHWIEHMDVSERQYIKQNEKPLFENSSELHFHKLPTAIQSKNTLWQEKRSVSVILEAFKRANREENSFWQKEKVQREKAQLKKSKLNQAQLVEKLKVEPTQENFRMLERYLKYHPQEVEALFEQMQRLDDNVVSRLINILERVGSVQAQSVLTQIMQTSLYSHANRLRATIALGGLKEVAQNTLDVLWEQVHSRVDNSSNELANSALLALGSLSQVSKSIDTQKMVTL
jgi:hypothetical protein